MNNIYSMRIMKVDKARLTWRWRIWEGSWASGRRRAAPGSADRSPGGRGRPPSALHLDTSAGIQPAAMWTQNGRWATYMSWLELALATKPTFLTNLTCCTGSFNSRQACKVCASWLTAASPSSATDRHSGGKTRRRWRSKYWMNEEKRTKLEHDIHEKLKN